MLPANIPVTVPFAGITTTTTNLWVAYGIVTVVLFLFTSVSSAIIYVLFVYAAVTLCHAAALEKPVSHEFEDLV